MICRPSGPSPTFGYNSASPNVNLFFTRVPSGLEVTGDTLAEMSGTIPDAAGLFPRSVEFDVVGYGCTSGTSVIGADRVHALVRSGCKTAHVSEPVSALIAACRELNVSRLAFLSPYIASVSQTLRDTLAASGVTTPVFGSFDEAQEAKVARISEQSIFDAALELGQSDQADCVFLSCTNLKTLNIIPKIEAALGKKVLSSNRVLAWHMAQLSGWDGFEQSPFNL
jgi:maleate isomerase